MKKLLLTLCLLLSAFTGISAEKIFDQTFTTRNFNASPLTISGLAGDTYDYTVILWTDATGHTGVWDLRLNGDSTNNYRSYFIRGEGSSASAGVNDSDNEISPLLDAPRDQPGLSIFTITGESGNERHVSSIGNGEATNSKIYKTSGYWKNTANEINSLTILSTVSATNDAHIIVYRNLKGSSQGRWEWLETKTFSGQNITSTPISFTGLNGDSDIKYKIRFNGEWSINMGDMGLRINSDTGSNYTWQRLYNSGGSIASQNLNKTYNALGTNFAVNTDFYAEAIIHAVSGQKRIISSSGAPIAASQDQNEISGWWNNTADPITSLQIVQEASSPSVTGSASLYRQSQGYGIGDLLPFRVYETVSVSGDFSAGHTFTGLSGDDYKLIKLEWKGANTSGTTTLRVQFNSDTGSNYSYQQLRAASSTVSAASTSDTAIEFGKFDSAEESNATFYLYPKSGDNRPGLLSKAFGTTAVQFFSTWWFDSGSEITSIKVFANNTNSLTGTLKLSILR